MAQVRAPVGITRAEPIEPSGAARSCPGVDPEPFNAFSVDGVVFNCMFCSQTRELALEERSRSVIA
eukprot:6373564-Amphidinium_carterae.1